ncbi:MAG: ECF transporter S component [Clostridia bacterium]|nr:ECF transporter S component [Clostridia bacterium]
MTNTDTKTNLLCKTAVVAALVCAGTFLSVPLPIGYFNLGDIFVLCGAWCLGPLWGAAAGGIGAMLADILMGYASYAPATLIIKAGIAAVAYAVYTALNKKNSAERNLPARILSALCGEAVMVGGYFVFEAVFMGYGTGALASVPGNCLQAAAGIIGGCVIAEALRGNRAGKFIGMR